MTTELNLIAVLDQFVEDLDEGVEPRIFELMASDPATLTELIPLLELITLVEASATSMPDDETERVKARILGKAKESHASHSDWSLRRLEEYQCTDCEGTGLVGGWLSLADLAERIREHNEAMKEWPY